MNERKHFNGGIHGLTAIYSVSRDDLTFFLLPEFIELGPLALCQREPAAAVILSPTGPP